jgi:glycosyltransferase involved in cell wall biosynthesis
MDIRILFLTAETCPTFRADVNALFGKYLPRYGIQTDIVAGITPAHIGEVTWGGGKTFLCDVSGWKPKKYLKILLHGIRILLEARPRDYHAIQVRDMPVLALIGLAIARLKGLRFFYWMSFPIPEGQIELARERRFSAGIMKFIFPWLRGRVGRSLLNRFVLPRADFIFVQTDHMKASLVAHGLDALKMKSVPMGADIEAMRLDAPHPSFLQFEGRRVLIYLGTMDRQRRIEILLEMLALVKERVSNVLLVMVGDTEDDIHRAWLRQKALEFGVSNEVLWTGWLPIAEGWRYASSGDIGLSPIPRSPVLDVGSPTKALEYMALGLPVVGNDNPDQAAILRESGAGLCVEFGAETFANGVIRLLEDKALRKEMAARGPEFIRKKRSYQIIAGEVQVAYRNLFSLAETERPKSTSENRPPC